MQDEFENDLDPIGPAELFLCEFQASLSIALSAMAENRRLRKDEKYWREKYQELLSDSIKTSEVVSGNIVMLALKGVR